MRGETKPNENDQSLGLGNETHGGEASAVLMMIVLMEAQHSNAHTVGHRETSRARHIGNLKKGLLLRAVPTKV